jgi:hypothetical protein
VANRHVDDLGLVVTSAGLGIMGVIFLAAGVERVADGRCRSFAADQDCYVFIVVGLVCLGLAYAFGAAARHLPTEMASGTIGATQCARCGREYPPEAMSRLSRIHAVPVILSGFTSFRVTDAYCHRCKRIMDVCLVGLGLAGVAATAYYLGWW